MIDAMSTQPSGARISGSGRALGARCITNAELAAVLESSDDWIVQRTGIRTRYFIEPGQSNTSLALEASRAALDNAALNASELDAIVFATLSPDMVFPGNGVLLQEALGVAPIPALDVRNQCSGFLYALSVAGAWIRSGMYRRVLVVGSEVHSTGLDLSPQGRAVSILFGDGAGAVVVEAADTRVQEGGALEAVRLGADGSGARLLFCDRPGAAHHPSITSEDLEAGRHYAQMEGRQVFRRAVELLSQEIGALIARHRLDPQRAVLVAHQSNRRINELVAERTGIPEDRVLHTIEQWGNTTAGSIPMALDLARREGRMASGDPVIMAAFGSGLTWGTTLMWG
ncbi:beta-ketoacyl-ACP synthase III [Bradymonadaceae bacterium TMQ3]|nr:beta-ketoacyl-ACP synthase III [Bradymonadaceae bacterium TMQ3]